MWGAPTKAMSRNFCTPRDLIDIINHSKFWCRSAFRFFWITRVQSWGLSTSQLRYGNHLASFGMIRRVFELPFLNVVAVSCMFSLQNWTPISRYFLQPSGRRVAYILSKVDIEHKVERYATGSIECHLLEVIHSHQRSPIRTWQPDWFLSNYKRSPRRVGVGSRVMELGLPLLIQVRYTNQEYNGCSNQPFPVALHVSLNVCEGLTQHWNYSQISNWY